MIFWGVITICNLILAHNEDSLLSSINFFACIGSTIYFIYLYINETKNKNK